MLTHRYVRLRPDAKGKSAVSSNSKLIELQARTALKSPRQRYKVRAFIVSIAG
jgi:hypothetical protein